jgi:hypothetical protein
MRVGCTMSDQRFDSVDLTRSGGPCSESSLTIAYG